MKVILVNGSPHKAGCTFTALSEVAGELIKQGVEAEIFHIGIQPIRGCMGCDECAKRGGGKCVFHGDAVNEMIDMAESADGFVFGSPVHYAAAAGSIASFLDRVFYSGKRHFVYKPGAAVVSCRRGGATAALDQLNKYFTISSMPVVSSLYWNMVHGNTPAEVLQDLEGMQTMRQLARNMAWMLKCIAAGKAAGISLPQEEARVVTNFIR